MFRLYKENKGDNENMIPHKEKSKLAGESIPIKSGGTYLVEDWWDKLVEDSWKHMKGNPACIIYALRVAILKLPDDDEVLYGHTEDGLGHLIHVSEVDNLDNLKVL